MIISGSHETFARDFECPPVGRRLSLRLSRIQHQWLLLLNYFNARNAPQKQFAIYRTSDISGDTPYRDT